MPLVFYMVKPTNRINKETILNNKGISHYFCNLIKKNASTLRLFSINCSLLIGEGNTPPSEFK